MSAFVAGPVLAMVLTLAGAGAPGRVAAGNTRAGASAVTGASERAAFAGSVIGPERPTDQDAGFVPFHHGSFDRVAFGGEAEARFASDRLAGVANPDWLSVVRVGAFVSARLHPRARLVASAAYDQATDDLVVERAAIEYRAREHMTAQAGVLLLPLGRTNFEHAAAASAFTNRSYVATELIGVPSAQVGAGIKSAAERATRFSYELDLVTGYEEGVVTGSPLGTRVSHGRSNFGNDNGAWALAGRLALRRGEDAEIGLACEAGRYNQTRLDGVQLDDARQLAIVVADGVTSMGRMRVAAEAAAVLIEVPPGLEGLYAERQWGASIELERALWGAELGEWRSRSMSVAVRADAVDLDGQVLGDSRARLSTSLNVRGAPPLLTRFGWYYELRRDRFDNLVPAAGVTMSMTSAF